MVSVCIISYNQKDYIVECVKSCATQNVDNLEVIVSDDASTDGTQDILLDLQSQFKDRLKVILNKENVGITANSNIAYHTSKGDYVAWLGGDDVMLPSKLVKQHELMQASPMTALCYHDLDVFDSTTNKTLRYFNHGPGSAFPYQGGAENLVRHGVFCGACSIMTRRKACPREGFNPRLLVASDWLFWIETAINGQIAYIPEVLGRYRRHANNVTAGSKDPTDQLVTLGIVESKFPHLGAYARQYRARHYYTMGVERILCGKKVEARAMFKESLAQGWVSWKWAGWMLRSFLA